MRIIYGCNTQGQGHLSKAAALVPILRGWGHDVHVVSSGPNALQGYTFEKHLHVPGLEYVIQNGQTDYQATAAKWARSIPKMLVSLSRVKSLVREFQPEAIVSDFEPFTASPMLGADCPVISVSRQVTLCDPEIPSPEGLDFDRRLARSTIRLFLMGSDRQYGYHYEPTTWRSLPPIIRPELASVTPKQGDYLFIYNFHHCNAQRADELVRWANSRRQPAKCYGFLQEKPRGFDGMVEFCKPGRDELLNDLANARAVITTAGFTLPIEAYLFDKPTSVVPIPNQWEQLTNAFHLENAGMSKHLTDWDYDAAMEVPIPERNDRLEVWLRTPAEAVLKQILG